MYNGPIIKIKIVVQSTNVLPDKGVNGRMDIKWDDS